MAETILLIPWEDDDFLMVKLVLEQTNYNIVLGSIPAHQIQFNDIKNCALLTNPKC